MKKMISLLMVFALAILPFASLAEVTTKEYALPEIGLSMNLPAGWAIATKATAANNPLNDLFGLTQADTLQLLSDTGSSLYGVCDQFGITHMAVLHSKGINMVDMQQDHLNMDAFMKGFLTSYTNVKDSGYFKTDAAWFAYVHYMQQDVSGDIEILQFVTNVNGSLYIIQFMSMYGVAINEVSEGLFRQAVESIRFIND